MKNAVAFSLIVAAFAVGSLLPYFYLNGKINKTNSKMDKVMGSVEANSNKIDTIRLVKSVEKDANILQENVSDISDQKLINEAIVQIEYATELANQVKSTNNSTQENSY